MNRTTPPDGADTNTRPYLIFCSYMLTCLSVAIFIIRRIFQAHTLLEKSTTAPLPPRKHVWLFSGLAAGSLLTTWTFMIKYFNFSYQSWFSLRSYYELDPNQRHWGLWLKETSLFREAWETVVVGIARYWWSHQIFFFALGLGLYMEQRGVGRGIKHTWAIMLLGQIVAISFATNLFLLTLMLSTSTVPSQATSSTQRSKSLVLGLLNLGALCATAVPAYLLADDHYCQQSTDFMTVLLTPHVALLVLPFARAFLPAKYFPDQSLVFNKAYSSLWVLTFANAAIVMLKVTRMAISYGGLSGIRNALFEHPAVSSVGFDVIFCWITWICWMWTQGGKDTCTTRKSTDGKKETFEYESVARRARSEEYGDNVRRR